MTRRLFDRAGVEVELGPELARGGEGAVFALARYPGFVAKLYHEAPEPDKAAKLAAMVAGRTKRLDAHAAWPVELLARTRGAAPSGIVLPRVSGYHDLHLLYGPRSRLRTFPLAGWAHLVRAATNLARSFAVVHEHGHVLGDVNDRVALVSDQALVKLIDCDGFQVRHGQGVFTCDVGVPSYQPPELQGVASFRGLVRTENHDAFGLAVLVFQLLFLARHPFSGTWSGGDLPLERAIQEHRFVYGARAAELGLSPPPAALELAIVTPELARLFERAFGQDGARGTRPRAREWATALDGLARILRTCRKNPLHAYREGTRCPFCALERRSDAALFHLPIPATNSAGKRGAFMVHVPALWKEIVAVPAPAPAPALPARVAELGPGLEAEAARRRRRLHAALGLAAGALVAAPFTQGLSLAGMLALPALLPSRARAAASRRTRALLERWQAEARPDAFEEARRALVAARSELENLDRIHAERLAELESRRRELQLEAWLDSLPLAGAALEGLSRSAVIVLASNGIETALHLRPHALRHVPSLGRSVLRRLIAWRRAQERAFRYDPTRALEPDALERLERELQRRRAELVQALADGPARLRNAARQIEMRRRALQAETDAWLGR